MVERCFWEAEVTGSNPVDPILDFINNLQPMEVYSVEYWQENWDELMGRVENGETIGIENKETGEKCVMVPADDELLRIYTEQNNEAS